MSDNLEYCSVCSEPTGHAGAGEDSIFIPTNGRTIGPLCHPCLDGIRLWIDADSGFTASEAKKDAEVQAVIQQMPADCVVRVCEEGGPENIYATLAVSVAKMGSQIATLTQERNAYKREGETYAESIDNVRAALGLEATHYLIIHDQVADVVAERDHLRNAILVRDEYIKLLGDEIDDLAGLADAHGWRSTRYEAGEALRKRIAEADAAVAPQPSAVQSHLSPDRNGNCPRCGKQIEFGNEWTAEWFKPCQSATNPKEIPHDPAR